MERIQFHKDPNMSVLSFVTHIPYTPLGTNFRVESVNGRHDWISFNKVEWLSGKGTKISPLVQIIHPNNTIVFNTHFQEPSIIYEFFFYGFHSSIRESILQKDYSGEGNQFTCHERPQFNRLPTQ